MGGDRHMKDSGFARDHAHLWPEEVDTGVVGDDQELVGLGLGDAGAVHDEGTRHRGQGEQGQQEPPPGGPPRGRGGGR